MNMCDDALGRSKASHAKEALEPRVTVEDLIANKLNKKYAYQDETGRKEAVEGKIVSELTRGNVKMVAVKYRFGGNIITYYIREDVLGAKVISKSKVPVY
jgi:hypothetical protein